MTVVVDSRSLHFGVFYGLEPLPERPIAFVHGNCQAEALRRLLSATELSTVRVPPVHELVAGDVPHLRRLLDAAAVLVVQPVRTRYRGLPIGAADVCADRPSATEVVRIPTVHYAGLYPAQALVRGPVDPSLDPPVIPYHDLRVLAVAAGMAPPGFVSSRFDRATVRAAADRSLVELRRREVAAGGIVISDVLAAPDFDLMRTINHPGNAVLEPLAIRIADVIGIAPPPAAPRPLLSAIHAPRDPAVIDALGLDAQADDHWTLDGVAVDPEELRAAHMTWYADHPDVVAEGVRRHRATLDLLLGR